MPANNLAFVIRKIPNALVCYFCSIISRRCSPNDLFTRTVNEVLVKLIVTELISLALIYFAVIDPIGTIPIFCLLQNDLITNKSNVLP